MPWLDRRKDGTLVLSLHVQPGAAKTRLAGLHGDRLKLAVAAPPVDGKANGEIVRFLAKVIGCAARDVEVIAGQTSRQKRVAVYRCSEVDIRKIAER
ncbi:MAG: YggU family protein [Deltaproteobacteria bacterium]|nr:MAG: YggU family protein [Deltaproteobacteria bacterium]